MSAVSVEMKAGAALVYAGKEVMYAPIAKGSITKAVSTRPVQDIALSFISPPSP